MSPALRRTSENMLVRPNGDGTYSATWTPASTGWYMVLVTIDGYPLEEVLPVLQHAFIAGPISRLLPLAARDPTQNSICIRFDCAPRPSDDNEACVSRMQNL
jgi:hypothetical protein